MNRQLFILQMYLFAGLIMLLTVPQTATAQIEKGTLWRDSVVTELDVDFGDTGFHARWHFHHCECGDLQVMVMPAGIFIIVNVGIYKSWLSKLHRMTF